MNQTDSLKQTDSLHRLGRSLYWVAKSGQMLVLAFCVVALVLAVAVPAASMLQPDMGSPPVKAPTADAEPVAAVFARLMLLIGAVYALRALGVLAGIGKLLTAGECLTDALAERWWYFSRSLTIASVFLLFSPRSVPDCGPVSEMRYDYLPDISNLYFCLVTILSCYTIAFILREAARTKREELKAKEENAGFV